MKNLAKPEALERQRHPPLWLLPMVMYLEWYTGPGTYALIEWMNFNTQVLLGSASHSTPVD
jgi:hypothetical protein